MKTTNSKHMSSNLAKKIGSGPIKEKSKKELLKERKKCITMLVEGIKHHTDIANEHKEKADELNKDLHELLEKTGNKIYKNESKNENKEKTALTG